MLRNCVEQQMNGVTRRFSERTMNGASRILGRKTSGAFKRRSKPRNQSQHIREIFVSWSRDRRIRIFTRGISAERHQRRDQARQYRVYLTIRLAVHTNAFHAIFEELRSPPG